MIKSASSNKSFPNDDIPIKILKNSIHIFNEWLIDGKFPDTLKWADVTLIFLKKIENGKENLFPVSILSTFSKVFEKLIFEQINDSLQSKFCKYLPGFRKNYCTHNALLLMITILFLRQRYTVKIFLQSNLWNTISGKFHETWNTFMKYFYFSI